MLGPRPTKTEKGPSASRAWTLSLRSTAVGEYYNPTVRCASDSLQTLQKLIDTDIERILAEDVAAERERVGLIGTMHHH
jgi:hypothetical protein